MISAHQILVRSGVEFHPFDQLSARDVFITSANQLVGTHENLSAFRLSRPLYSQWDAHHVVEKLDLDRLGIVGKFPASKFQTCVLLPRIAHQVWVNSLLRNENPTRLTATAAELRGAYRIAYGFLGDYCQGGAERIRGELMAIVEAILREA